jgi:triacylglycerol esterase/lipase EstA (alpha/beta hydrolase family)
MASLRLAASWALLFLWASSSVLAFSVPNPSNNFTCQPTQSASGSDPIVILHGLGATYYEDINELESWLKGKGFCTFSLTYGAYENFPYVGGIIPIADSAPEIGALIQQVSGSATGAGKKVTLIGHSEGGFQALYVPKFVNGISSLVGMIISMAPPTHGTSLSGFLQPDLLQGLEVTVFDTVVNLVGCQACSELVVGGQAVGALDNGPIVQPGNTVTIIASTHDELVTPPDTSFINEPDVTNLFIQTLCPDDPVGHVGEAYDQGVWNIILNALNGNPTAPVQCSQGPPFK